MSPRPSSFSSRNRARRTSREQGSRQPRSIRHRYSGWKERERVSVLILEPRRLPVAQRGGAVIDGLERCKVVVPFGGSILPQLADELQGCTMTKSALHVPVDRPPPKTLLTKLIRLRLASAGC